MAEPAQLTLVLLYDYVGAYLNGELAAEGYPEVVIAGLAAATQGRHVVIVTEDATGTPLEDYYALKGGLPSALEAALTIASSRR